MSTQQATANDKAGESRTRTSDRRLLAFYISAAVIAVLTIVLFCASLPARHNELLNLQMASHTAADYLRAIDPESVRIALAELGISTNTYVAYTVALEVTYAFVFFVVAAIIARRKPDDPMAVFVALTLVLFGTASLPTMQALATAQPMLSTLISVLNALGYVCAFIMLCIFPDGRFVPHWIRYLAIAFAVWELSWAVFPDAFFSPMVWPPTLTALVWSGQMVVGTCAQIYRYMKVSDQTQRRQTKWVLFGAAVAVIGSMVVGLPNVLAPRLGMPLHPGALYELLRPPLQYLVTLAFPISIGIAVVRYRLYDIDLIVNRTLVYVPLTGILAGLYAASITLFQKLFVAVTGQQSDAAIVLTTLILATTFTPIKNALQGLVDRRFKEAPDPAKRLKAFGKQIESDYSVLDPMKVMRRLLDESVEAFGAKSGALYVPYDGQPRLVYSHGEWHEGDAELSVSIEHEGNQHGLIRLGERKDGRDYPERDEKALQEVAEVVARAIC